MKQTTFTGEELDVRDFRRRRNRIEAPDDPDVWAGCMDEECGVTAAQNVTDEKEYDLVKILCFCTCHDDPPEEELVSEHIVYPDKDGEEA